MPEPAPAPTPPAAPPAAPAAPVAPPISPAAPVAPPQTPPGPMGTSFAAALHKAYPDGVIPSAQPQIGLQPLAPQFGNQPTPPPAPAPPTGITGPAAPPAGVSGPTGAATGPSGPPATGATGPAASGPSGPPTKEQLDATEKAMPLAAGTAFKIVRAENAALEQKLAAAAEKLTAAEQKASEASTDSKATAELREKLERAEKELAVVNVEATDSFQKTITKPIKAAEANLAQLAAKYEVPLPELRAALAEPDAGKRSDALSELSAKFNRLDTVAFDRTVTELANLEQARAGALATAAEQLAQAQAERTRAAADQTKAFEKDWALSRDKALEDLNADKTAVGVIFAPTGDEKFDADVAAAIDTVKAVDVTKLTNQQIAADMFRSRVLPLATKLISSQYSKIEVLEAEIAQLRGGTPPQGDGLPPQPATTHTVPPGASFRDVAKQALQGVLPP